MSKTKTASDVVKQYLNAMEARDVEQANALLAEGFTMTFPGNQTFTTLAELIEWAKPRYKFVNKSYDRFDEAADGADTIVYCYGTLAGEFPDGTPFSNIRFIDRFRISNGLLLDQMVWNDLAEYKISIGLGLS